MNILQMEYKKIYTRPVQEVSRLAVFSILQNLYIKKQTSPLQSALLGCQYTYFSRAYHCSKHNLLKCPFLQSKPVPSSFFKSLPTHLEIFFLLSPKLLDRMMGQDDTDLKTTIVGRLQCTASRRRRKQLANNTRGEQMRVFFTQNVNKTS